MKYFTMAVLVSVSVLFAATTGARDTTQEAYFEGKGISSSPFLLKTKEDLLKFGELMSDSLKNIAYGSKSYKLLNDIELDSTIKWNLRCFSGYFDGGNHVIRGLYAKGNTAGFFSEVKKATVENLGIEDSRVHGTYDAGAIAGRVEESNINNCWNANTSVYASRYAGGVVGIAETCLNGAKSPIYINRIYNTGTVTGLKNVGGLVGIMTSCNTSPAGTIYLSNGYNRGRVESTGYYRDNTALLAGITTTERYVEIQNVYNAGPVIYEGPSNVSRTYKLGFNKYASKSSYCGYYNVWNLKASADDDGLTNEEMRSREFAKMMGDGFAYDSLNVNDGYPVLSGEDVKWQTIPIDKAKSKPVSALPQVSVSSQTVAVAGLKKGQQLALIDLNGNMVWEGHAAGNVQQIHVTNRGIYLLKTENAAIKVFVK